MPTCNDWVKIDYQIKDWNIHLKERGRLRRSRSKKIDGEIGLKGFIQRSLGLEIRRRET